MNTLYNDALRAARHRAGMTLEQVAEALHVSKVAISKFERGIGSEPRICRLIQLADLYGISIDELVGRH